MTNPLLAPWNTPFGFPPFDKITDADFEPAFDTALTAARDAVNRIADAAEDPTFANTIEALERCDEDLDRVLSAFFAVAGTDANPEREALMRKFSPQLAAYGSELSMNAALFQRIEALWSQQDSLNLTEEQTRLLFVTRRRFVRAGANLNDADKSRLADIMKRLATLGTQFTQNLLADEKDWFYPLGPDDLAGLPDFVISAAQEAGEERGQPGPVLTLSRSLVVPFLQFSPRRDLREKAFQAWAARGANGGDTDNREIAAETLALRAERAKILGYASFAEYKLEPEMAGTPGAVRDLLMRVWAPAKARADDDAGVLSEMMRADGINDTLQPWDWRYYGEQRRAAEHDLDEAALKHYFQLDRMIEASFACANRLFDLEFQPVTVPGYHADVRTWDVTRNGAHVALFVGDYFGRSSKRSGAWCSAMRSQQKLAGDIRPIVVNVCNFAKPASGKPALLSFDDARTLFHEFGHALHQMLSDVTYQSLSGTSVARDFVELPSQLYEHWLEVPEILQEFATHAETGAPIPKAMLDRLLAAKNADQGFATVEYLESALVDLAFHSGEAPADPMAFQAQVLEDLEAPHAIPMRHATPQFAHVFSGDGYSSGYYSYMWSEVMDADAFKAFEEADGPFDRDMARKLEASILSVGGTRDAAALYTEFRGRLPEVEALLKGRGLAA